MLDVCLLHGLGADHRAFQRFQRLLPADWSISSLDLLGHGDAPHPTHGYRLDDHAAWVERSIAADVQTVLIGHSYGAAASVAVAARRPDLVRALVLLDPIVHLDESDSGTGTESMVQAKRTGTIEAQVATMYPEASDALRAWTVETWERMAMGVVDELDLDWTRFADQVTAPVAIIHGELQLGGGGDLAADWFDDPDVTCIAGAGHYLHATHARATAAAIVAALERIIGV